ncbi:MAG: Nramp family divalent metal transporter [bacterium]|nr:Nramp family divalent metal transporter [bacterium]
MIARLRLSLRSGAALLAPGLLVAATGIGAGDLITAALAGIRTGVDLLWAVAIGAVFKCALNEGLARFQLATDRSLLEGWLRHLGPWIRPVFLIYFILWSFVVAGALMNACGIAGTAVYPLHSDPAVSKIIWGLLHSAAACALVWIMSVRGGGFRLFEGVMAAAIVMMFLAVLGGATLLRPDAGAIISGLFAPGLRRPDDAVWVFALIGGVGGTVTMLSYGYWIRESGRQGLSGLRKSRIDLVVAYGLTALFSMAMIVLADRLAIEFAGDADKSRLPLAIANEMGRAIGPIGMIVFLFGFWAAVFSSMLGVWQSAPYLFADFARLATGGTSDDPGQTAPDETARPGDAMHEVDLPGSNAPEQPRAKGHTPQDLKQQRGYRLYLLALATLPAITLFARIEAVQLSYAVLGSLFMPLLAGTLLYLNNRKDLVGESYRNRFAANLLLSATLLFFAVLGARQLLRIAGF